MISKFIDKAKAQIPSKISPSSSPLSGSPGADGSIAQRPGYLPAKSGKEAEKHAKEYSDMLERYRRKQALDAEEAAKKERAKLQKEERARENRILWDTVLESWPKERASRRVRALFWAGVPPAIRGKVWRAALGNDLHVTRELFTIFGKRAAELKQQKEDEQAALDALHIQQQQQPSSPLVSSSASSSSQQQPHAGKEHSVRLIKLDLPRTFPALSFFSPDGPMFSVLSRVLEAYTCFRPDVGYVQGMSYLAAILLLNMDEYDAFCCLANLLNQPCLLVFYKMDAALIERYVELIRALMRAYCPRAARTFEQQHIVPQAFVVDWVLTVFGKALPLDTAVRVWDLFMYEGEYVLFRTLLGLLKLYEDDIERGTFDDNMQFLTHLPGDIDQDALFKSIHSVSLSKAKFDKMRVQLVGDTDAILRECCET